MSTGRTAVVLAAAGAAWEADALRRLESAGPGVVLLRRCVDLADLLAAAATGQAAVAVVAPELPGLDTDSVDLLHRHGTAVVAVTGDAAADEVRLRRIGVEQVLPADTIAALDEVVRTLTIGMASMDETVPPDTKALPAEAAPEPVDGRVVAVWGPTGAPGRTTVAVGLAAELAHRRSAALLLDVDGYGGAVAQHLGVLDEMSGLLAAARLANAGQLDDARLTGLARAINPHLRVITGLPRADRWTEVRPGAFDQLLGLSRTLAPWVVLDTGFCLEEEAEVGFGGAPRRHAMTFGALETADEVVVVGSADPVGLARLARGLVELREAVPGCRLRVAVNRSRSSLGWGEKEVRGMVEGFVTPESVHFLPEDRAATDRAMLAGRSLVELGDSPLRRALAALVDALTGEATSGVRRRRFGRRRAGQAPKSR